MVPGGVGYKLGKQPWATGEVRDNRNWQQGQPHAGESIESSICGDTAATSVQVTQWFTQSVKVLPPGTSWQTPEMLFCYHSQDRRYYGLPEGRKRVQLIVFETWGSSHCTKLPISHVSDSEVEKA